MNACDLYMIAGPGTPDQLPARLFAYRYPEAFAKLIHLLTIQRHISR